jgi:exopolysaccharide biosynthesis protein
MTAVNNALPPGVRVYAGLNSALPLRAWYVRVDERDPSIVTRVLMSDDIADNRETVTSFAADHDACVAVNAGYFNMSRTPAIHAGLLLTAGQLRAAATRTVTRDSLRYETARAAIGFTEHDEIEITWASTHNDTVLAWRTPPAHRPGVPSSLPPRQRARRWDVRDAVAAGPMLVVDGRPRVTVDEEVFFGSSIPRVHPRTAVGITGDGALLIVVVDGRQPQSRGVDLEELATILQDLGAVQALNLDGGGSSALVVNGVLLNRPAGSSEQREVMSALVTFCDGSQSTEQER